MSPNLIFSHNLRRLCASRPSIAQVARDLEIGKVQMTRFLNGASHPKPAVLKRICGYFGVDARIVLDVLDDDALANRQHRQSPGEAARFGAALNPAATDGFAFALGPRALCTDETDMPPGLYLQWRRSFAHTERFVRLPLLVRRHRRALVVRGYDARALVEAGYLPRQPAPEREFRGVVLNRGNGVTIITLHAEPFGGVSMVYAENMPHLPTVFYSGFCCLGRSQASGGQRVSNVLMERLEGEDANPVRIAHAPSFYEADALPPLVRRVLSAPVDPLETLAAPTV